MQPGRTQPGKTQPRRYLTWKKTKPGRDVAWKGDNPKEDICTTWKGINLEGTKTTFLI